MKRSSRVSTPIAVLLIFAVLLSAGSGFYAGAALVPQQAPYVTITTTIYTTTTSWTTSTLWSTVTEVVEGVLTTVEYTTSTSTVTVTGVTTTRTTPTTTAGYKVTVTVKDSATGGAVGGAWVYLDGVSKGSTTSYGVLTITGVAYGQHTLTVSRAYYQTATQQINVTRDTSVTIPLKHT